MTTSHILQEEGELFEKEVIQSILAAYPEDIFPSGAGKIMRDMAKAIASISRQCSGASNLRVAKSVLQRVREENGEDEVQSMEDSADEHMAKIWRNGEKRKVRLACDTIERELEGDNT